MAQVSCYCFNDTIPLWMARRRGGEWKPEYRLQSLWVPGLLILPIGLGIFGAGLEYHLHYMVLALGAFLITTGAMAIVPTTTNYYCECFTKNTAEASCALGFYRLIFGLTVPFFIHPWIAATGVGWVFGIAAFLTLILHLLPLICIFKGHDLRQLTWGGLNSNEEGAKLVKTVSSSDEES